MANFLRRTPPKKKQNVETITSENTVDILSSEFKLNKEKVSSILRSVGINLEAQNPAGELELYREVIASKIGDRSRFLNPDETYIAELDEQLRSFDEIYVDTAPSFKKTGSCILSRMLKAFLSDARKKINHPRENT